jgi:hypothetical protein
VRRASARTKAVAISGRAVGLRVVRATAPRPPGSAAARAEVVSRPASQQVGCQYGDHVADAEDDQRRDQGAAPGPVARQRGQYRGQQGVAEGEDGDQLAGGGQLRESWAFIDR